MTNRRGRISDPFTLNVRGPVKRASPAYHGDTEALEALDRVVRRYGRDDLRDAVGDRAEIQSRWLIIDPERRPAAP